MERCEKGKKGSCLRAGKLSSLPGLSLSHCGTLNKLFQKFRPHQFPHKSNERVKLPGL